MFEDDGITFKREVECDKKKRKIWKKKKKQVYLSHTVFTYAK